MENTKTDKLIFRLIIIVSVIVFALVAFIYQLPKAANIPDYIKILPTLNACINATCALLLILSLYMIKNGNIAAHKKINITAFVLSALFLVSYIIFHSYGIETRYPADNPLRPFYLFILLTHIILAAIVLPLVFISFYYGLNNKVEKHRKIVRFSYPVWLYVTVTGVIVYLMISPYYQF
ncbi:MAG: DUF420 domain-containing protein [Bacteroidia bacterium]|nr:DUF420 domain-containing protein [Bacteroidia bacterium]